MDNVHIFLETAMFSSFLFRERRANGAPFFFSARPFFNWNFPRHCSVFCFVSFSYVRNKRGNEIWVLSCLWHLLFFFRVAAPNYDLFFRTPTLKKKSMVRPWCAQNVFLFPPIIMVSLLITRFLLPALRCTLFASRSLLLSARCSMISYYF